MSVKLGSGLLSFRRIAAHVGVKILNRDRGHIGESNAHTEVARELGVRCTWLR